MAMRNNGESSLMRLMCDPGNMKSHAPALSTSKAASAKRNAANLLCARIRLTRHKISDRWRGRVWLQVECGSHRKLERGAASGSPHRLLRALRIAYLSRDFVTPNPWFPIPLSLPTVDRPLPNLIGML